MSSKPPVGGGTKKVLYTLKTVRRIGLKRSARALSAKNTCKACGLGMGGQRGGMTNELGEFPSVCNKSIQAQSTDIQQPIPSEIFDHSLDDLRELSARELEHLGRLDTPVFKSGDNRRYQAVSWDWGLDYAARQFAGIAPDRSFFYSSGRASNEAGFILQLLARLYGTNNVNNCSYYCHQATSVALGNSIGTGTATVELEDLHHCDLAFVIGANPASNHPRFIHLLKGIRDRGGEVVVINPAREPGLIRFAVPKSARSMISGGTYIASDYLQPRIGTDISLLQGLAKAVLAINAEDRQFIDGHTDGFEDFRAELKKLSWQQITDTTGIARAEIERVADIYARSKACVLAWGMGMTHHLHGVENIEYIANLALLRGMVGKPHAGLLPLRGHSNVQGIGTIGVKPVLAADVFAAIENELGVRLPSSTGMDTMACLQAADQGNIDAALMMGGNLYGASPDADWSRRALDRIGFKLYLTTTLNQGHLYGIDQGEALILPVSARDEEWQATSQESMFNYVRLSDGGIDRLENVRPESHILCDLAQRLLKDCPFDFEAFKSHRHIRETIAATIPGMEQLAGIDVAKREFHVRGRLLHKPVFNTASGRARFITRPRITTPIEDGFPFSLMTVRSEGQFNTIIYEESDSYRDTDSRWAVLMGAADMDRLGLRRGDSVSLESRRGQMRGVRVYPFDLPAGNLMAYFPEANILTGTEVDPRSRTPGFKSIAVAVTPD